MNNPVSRSDELQYVSGHLPSLFEARGVELGTNRRYGLVPSRGFTRHPSQGAMKTSENSSNVSASQSICGRITSGREDSSPSEYECRNMKLGRPIESCSLSIAFILSNARVLRQPIFSDSRAL